MAKKVKFLDGYEGVVSDKVAAILEKKAAAEILGDANKPEPKKAKADDKK